jgi:outer membrane receptor protein involved in Fe transport
VKTLINGRPIADYPALYNGTDVIQDISTIPSILVDRIEILPGGQSSIYGSDAIAGVINIILKQKQDGLQVDYRYGFTSDGGGTQHRIGLSDGFSVGGLNVVVGGQYDHIDPIWGYQRPDTRRYFSGNPTSPPVAERDWVVFNSALAYDFLDPNSCGNLLSQFGGTVAERTRGSRGSYCGTFTSGYYTLNNGTESEQAFLNATFDVSDKLQLYSEVLFSHAVTSFNTGGGFFSTIDDTTSPYYYYYDPRYDDFLNLQQIYSPEEIGDLNKINDYNTNKSIRATLGARGDLFGTGWKWNADFTYTQNQLTEATHLQFSSKIYNYYSSIFGPDLGPDPYGAGAQTFEPNYAQFYSPVKPSDYAGFSGYAVNHSETQDSLARGQLTNTALFHLPGGDAGIALEVEGGRQGWVYNPDPAFLNGQAYLYTSTAGNGHRVRYAGTSELRLPVLEPVTITLSGRYDDYQVAGSSVSKFTYNAALEYRPLKSLLLRGRYGTAFKAPTLADEFQGLSGFYQGGLNDYLYCYSSHNLVTGAQQTPYTPATVANCSQYNNVFFGQTRGNPALAPINATVADAGLVWSPFERSSFSIDFLHWDIKEEVFQQDINTILRTEAACDLSAADAAAAGITKLDDSSPICKTVDSEVSRSQSQGGQIAAIFDPKLNLSEEKLGDLVMSGDYTLLMGHIGSLRINANYTRAINHGVTLFPGSAELDYLNNPFWSTEFRTKENIGITWFIGNFNTTVYVERYGKTGNNLAQQIGDYSNPKATQLNPWTITNWSAQYEAMPGLSLTVNINNLFNRMPPFDASFLGTSNLPYNIFNYNNYGREIFLGASYKLK